MTFVAHIHSEKITTVTFFATRTPDIYSPSKFPVFNTVPLALVNMLSTRDTPGPGWAWAPARGEFSTSRTREKCIGSCLSFPETNSIFKAEKGPRGI